MHHRLQTDHNFQDLGYDFLQKPSAEYLYLKLDREKSHKNFYLGCVDLIARYLHKPLGPDVVPGIGCGVVIILKTSFFTASACA